MVSLNDDLYTSLLYMIFPAVYYVLPLLFSVYLVFSSLQSLSFVSSYYLNHLTGRLVSSVRTACHVVSLIHTANRIKVNSVCV